MKWEPDNSEEYKKRVLEARAMPLEEKFLAGERLFHEECKKLKMLIRQEMPDLREEMVDAELARRLDKQEEEEASLWLLEKKS